MLRRWIERLQARLAAAGWDRRDALVLAGCSLLFALLSLRYWAYTMDDALITARYARHWADGHGIVWNIGEDPVEGSTSFLWVAVLAATLAAGFPLVATAKLIGCLAVLAAGSAVYLHGRWAGHRRTHAALALVAILGNALVAFHATTAMETGLSVLFGTALALAAMVYLRTGDRAWSRGMFVFGVGALLTRPDLGAFVVPLVLGIGWFRARLEPGAVRPFVKDALLWAVLPGAAYMAWRVQYFGHLLPNAFYVKTGVHEPGTVAVQLIALCGVAFAPLSVACVAAWRGRRCDPRLVQGALVVLSAAALFLASNFQAAPIMAFLSRYQMPVVGAVVAAMLALTPTDAIRVDPSTAPKERKGVVWMVGLLAVAGPVAGVAWTDLIHDFVHSPDRMEAAEALSALDLVDVRLYTSEAGWVPYLTGWWTKDHVGLNDEAIAHGTDFRVVLAEAAPDLVMVHQTRQAVKAGGDPPELFDWLSEHGYELVAVDPDSREAPFYQVYWVSPESPFRDALACTVLGFEDRPDLRQSRLNNTAYAPVVDVAALGCPGP